MGIRHWILVLGYRCNSDRVFHGGNVRSDGTNFTIDADSHLFSIYDRTVKPIPEPTTTGLRYRIETLIGITGFKMQKYRISWFESIFGPFRLVWRPHLLMLLIFEVISHLPL